jgi:hypothetical protein
MSSGGEQYTTDSSSYPNKECKTIMLQIETRNTSNNDEIINRSDDVKDKVLNIGGEDSVSNFDIAANALCDDTSPNIATPPVNGSNNDVIVTKTVEAKSTGNHETAIIETTNEGGTGTNDVVLTFPQRVRSIRDKKR